MFSFLLLSIFSLLVLPIFLISLFLLTYRPTADSYPLRDYPLIGNLPQFLQNRHRLLDWFTDLLARSPTSTIHLHRFGGIRGVITANPGNVEHILRTRFDNYPKGARFSSILADFLGRGIFNTDGEDWRGQRKTASFEFNTRSLRAFVVGSVQGEITSRLVPLLQRAAEQRAALDLQDVLERFAFDNVCKVAFGEDPACLEELLTAVPGDDHGTTAPAGGSMGFPDAFRDAANLSAGRFRYAVPRSWKIKKLLGVGSERRLRDSIDVVHRFAEKIIRARREEKERGAATREDLLSRFIAAGDYSDEYLRDIVISFLLAGRETTSSGLSWFFWLLASHTDVEGEILDELRSIRARIGKTREQQLVFGLEELRGMHYLHAAITESMRLYPPVPQNSITCMEDDVLPDGTKVKKGSFVSYSPYAMGRTPAIWGEDCREYKPDRWLVPAEEGDDDYSRGATRVFRPESPFRFPAFHAGPRLCLGKEMAYIQMKSIAACLLEGFHVEVLGKERRPEHMLSLTLRMRDGLPVKLRCRET